MTVAYYDIPYKPNSTQAEIHKNLKQYNVVVVHRGLGKTRLCIEELKKEAWLCPVRGASYVYLAPTRVQAERIAWSMLKTGLCYYKLDEEGNRVKDSSGKDILLPMEDIKIREDKLTVTFLHNDVTIFIGGTDDPDSMRGIHPHGVVMDETGMHNREAWFQTILPSIQRNDGWVIFIGTPKGNNLFKELYDLGCSIEDGSWYTMYRDVNQTGIYSIDKVANLRRIMPVPEFEQEYLLKWDATFTGAYYTAYLNNPEMNIVQDVPWDPSHPVITGWDLGVQDLSVIWFAQQIDNKLHLIDYYEANNKDIYELISVVKSKPYRYSYHVVPHDISQRSQVSFKLDTRENVMKRCGFKLVTAPKFQNKVEGISIVQSQLYTCRIDRQKCALGIEHLRHYAADIDKMTGQPKDTPNHAHSDAPDALRTLITGLRKANLESYSEDWLGIRKQEVISEYDYFDH